MHGGPIRRMSPPSLQAPQTSRGRSETAGRPNQMTPAQAIFPYGIDSNLPDRCVVTKVTR
jgi:hypothetical protein